MAKQVALVFNNNPFKIKALIMPSWRAVSVPLVAVAVAKVHLVVLVVVLVVLAC